MVEIEKEELDEILEPHQFDIVDVIRTTQEMYREEDDPERVEYLECIMEYADAYLQTFETDRRLDRE